MTWILKGLFSKSTLKAENKRLKRNIERATMEINHVLEELKEPPNHEDEHRQKIAVFYRHVQIQNLERIRYKLN